MSAAYFIVLDKKKPGFDTMVNGKFLAQDAKRLEKIAKTLGLRSLDDYVSYAPDEARGMMEDMGLEPEEIEATKLPDEQWFKPVEGLKLIAKLSDHVRANPKSVKNAKGVLQDLEEIAGVLTKASAANALWHLQVDL